MNAISARITQGGRLVIPAAFRKSMKLADGEVVLLQMQGNVLQVRTIDDTLDAVQARYAQAAGSPSVVAEFIEERRREAAQELEP
jgi:bifunctional DNA-binding transcriptional regulator/antitoxin component of YhaV-PrlF toxin-antitoxin module